MAERPPPTVPSKRPRVTRLALASMLTGAALVGFVAGPTAADLGPSSEVASNPVYAKLQLSMTESDVHPGGIVTLVCSEDGDRGTHPSPELACDSLRAAAGDFEKLPPLPQACLPDRDPVRVRATGTWIQADVGHLVDYDARFPNADCAAIRTAGVFRF